jgi:hypothetical protein
MAAIACPIVRQGRLRVPGFESEPLGETKYPWTWTLLAVTLTATAAECASVPLLPVTVTVYVPTGAVAAALRVSVEEPEPETLAGEKPAVTPVGKPLAESETLPENPFKAATRAESVAEAPCCMATEVAVTDSVKSGAAGAAFTVSASEAEWLSDPLVPFTVNG